MNEKNNKRRNTSSENEAEAGSAKRDSFSGQSINASTMRRPSGLPVFSAVCKAGEPHHRRWWLGTTPNLLGRPWAQENAAQGRGGGAGQGEGKTNKNVNYKKQVCGLTIGCWN